MKISTPLNVVLIVAAVVGAFWTLGSLSNQYRRQIGGERESIEREVFEKSRSFVQGSVARLRKLRGEWTRTSDPTVRAALANEARGILDQLPEADVPSDLRNW